MKIVSVLLACALLGACASTQNLPASANALQAMEGKSLVVVQRETPSFVAMTSGKGMFAVAGVGAAAAAGNKMVKENGVADPAMTISRSLAENLAADFGVAVSEATQVSKSGDIDAVIANAADGDYTLDVATNGWSYIYDGFSFGDYYVGYSAKLRLVDVHAGTLVSSGSCAYDAKKAGKAPVSHEALLENNAAYVKQELAAATELCIQEFASKLFAAGAVARRSP